MKLQQLRFLVAVLKNGGVVKAAARLHVSQPAVSAALKALEHDLGQPLFEPAGRGRRARPTPKALDLYKNALEILARCDQARAQFQSSGAKSTTVRIGVLETIASGHVAGLYAAFSRTNRDHRLQLWEGGLIRLGEWLRLGRIDAAWTIVEKNTAQARVLWRERFAVVASHTHFLQHRRAKVSWADLDGESIVLRTSCEMRRGTLWPETLRLRVAARVQRDELAIRLVAQGVGIAILPESVATEEVAVRGIQDLEAERSVGLRWRRGLSEDIISRLLDAMPSKGSTGRI
jgi:DNA-binding transcriptional LysR family regulator